MNQPELRKLIRQADVHPVRVCLDDGRRFKISHPDFGLVTEDALIIASGPGLDLGESSYIVCYFDHISGVEVLKKPAKAA